MLLHADTLFESRRAPIQPRIARGHGYDLTKLIDEERLPRRVQFVWHGVNNAANLRQFLGSAVGWAEVDVQPDPIDREPVLRHGDRPNPDLSLEACASAIRDAGRGIKFDLTRGGTLVDRLLRLTRRLAIPDERLWFNGNMEHLRDLGFRKLKQARPEAIIQCPVDFLVPLMLAAPEQARSIVDLLRGWGVNRFSLAWRAPEKIRVVGLLEAWGCDVNVYGVPDLQSFLQAALLLPRSVTSDFNFPNWHYFGRGSGNSLDGGSDPRMAA